MRKMGLNRDYVIRIYMTILILQGHIGKHEKFKEITEFLLGLSILDLSSTVRQ